MLAQAPVWDEDSLCADESLDEPARKRPALLGANNVPVRLLQLAAELQVINSENDGTAVSRMQALPLATMTGQIREIEQRALQLARDEGREEFRTKALLNNLSMNDPPDRLTTVRDDGASSYDTFVPYAQARAQAQLQAQARLDGLEPEPSPVKMQPTDLLAASPRQAAPSRPLSGLEGGTSSLSVRHVPNATIEGQASALGAATSTLVVRGGGLQTALLDDLEASETL